jgi:hypothetical protein
LSAINWLVDIVHGGNVSPKPADGPLWFPYAVADIESLMGDDFLFYLGLRRRP